MLKMIIFHDRLGTNIGNALIKNTTVFSLQLELGWNRGSRLVRN